MEYSHILWKCPFTSAMLAIAGPRASKYNSNFVDDPIVGLLLYALPIRVFQNTELSSLSSHELAIITFLLRILQAKLRELASKSRYLDSISDLYMVRLMDSEFSHLRSSLARVLDLDTAVQSILALGLVDALRLHTEILRALVHWVVKQPYIAELHLPGLAIKAISMGLDQWFAQWTTREAYTAVSKQRLGWVNFLWSTMNSVLHPAYPKWGMELLRLCSNTVLLFQGPEIMEADSLSVPFSSLFIVHQSGYNPDHRRCTLLCYFRPMIRHSLLLIHEVDPTLRLDKDSWKSLVSALGQTAAEPWSVEPTWLQHWTPPAHRNGIQEERPRDAPSVFA